MAWLAWRAQVVVYRVTPYDGQGDGISKAKASDATHDPKSAPNMPPERPLIGRDTEMSFILNRAANMIAGMATGGAIVIEGNTGGWEVSAGGFAALVWVVDVYRMRCVVVGGQLVHSSYVGRLRVWV